MPRTRASIPIQVSVGSPTDPELIEPAGNGVHEGSPLDRSPLFSGFDVDEEQEIDHIVLTRIKPVREGDLGQIPADADEDFIRDEYGGGTYMLQGRTMRKRTVKGAYRTIDLAGDPIFRSDTARKQWEQIKRQKFGEPEKAPGVASVTPIRSVEDQISSDDARHRRRLEEIEAQTSALERRLKAEADAAVVKAKAEGVAAVEKAKAEGQAAIDRVRAESEDREKRDRAFFEAQKNQQQEFMAAVRKTESAADPMKMVSSIVGLITPLISAGGGEYPDAGTALVAKLPEILQEARGIATDVAAEASEKRDKKRAGKTAAGKDGDDKIPPITLKGDLATKVRETAQHLAKQGVKDPGKVIERMMRESFARAQRMKAHDGGKGKPAAKAAAKATPTKGKK